MRTPLPNLSLLAHARYAESTKSLHSWGSTTSDVKLSDARCSVATDTLSLTMLDPRRWSRLRGTEHAELKNDLMMALLWNMEWFVEYRSKLDAYREKSEPRHPYPTAEMERVEKLVDALIVAALDPQYQR